MNKHQKSSDPDDIWNRFTRTERLLGPTAFRRLKEARVCVVGLGAVGSYAVEGLARSGVGSFILVDFDEVNPSNINRQLYALESTLGQPKVDIATARVKDINPACRIEGHRLFVDSHSARQLMVEKPDLVIDAIDSLGPKVYLVAAAHKAGIPIISVMGAATRTDPALIRVADISETNACPLARWMRKRLKKKCDITSGVRCVFSVEPVYTSPEAIPSSLPEEPPPELEPASYRRGRARRPLGSLSMVTGIFGLTAAREALVILAGLPQHRPPAFALSEWPSAVE